MNQQIRRWWFAIAVICILAACSKPDPSLILGQWKADSFAFDSLKVPIAPNIEITRNQLILKTPDGTPIQVLALAAIRADRDNIELEIEDALGVSLVFSIESPNRIHFQVPFIGADIAYSKI